MSFCNFLLVSVLYIGHFHKPLGLKGDLARPPVIHVLSFLISLSQLKHLLVG
jgi:hypothetical protein